jgi:hypothetical protein
MDLAPRSTTIPRPCAPLYSVQIIAVSFTALPAAQHANSLFSGFSGVELGHPDRLDSGVVYDSRHHTMERATTGDPGKEGLVETHPIKSGDG